MLVHDLELTLQTPRARRMSRKMGTWKLVARVRRCGFRPGKSLEKWVAVRTTGQSKWIDGRVLRTIAAKVGDRAHACSSTE
jgi:hypothetical protein